MPFLLLILLCLQFINASAGPLSCKKVRLLLAQESSIHVRPYCDMAETRCAALALLEGLPPQNEKRKAVEGKLRAEVLHNLQVCDLAVEYYKIDTAAFEEGEAPSLASPSS